ncbi:hypothetical protein HDU76_010542, partial [Blyttiomyces sp. JEL0837]
FFGKKDTFKSAEAEIYADVLNETFRQFDSLLHQFESISKIKTIGTKCLLVATCDDPHKDIGAEVTQLALRIYYGMNNTPTKHGARFYRVIKIGIAHGPVVAGIVGEERFCYDFYGDAVNSASRMATLGLFDITCTREAYSSFDPSTKSKWKSLGIVSVKGKGDIEVYGMKFNLSGGGPRLPSLGLLPSLTISNQLDHISAMLKAQDIANPFYTSKSTLARAHSKKRGQPLKRTGTVIRERTESTYSMKTDLSTKAVTISRSSMKVAPSEGPVKRSAEMKNDYEDLAIDDCDDEIDDIPECILPALDEIVKEVSPKLLTSTTDSLRQMLSLHLVPWKLIFRNANIEVLFRMSARKTRRKFSFRHGGIILIIMAVFSVIVTLYEIFLYAKVGRDVEQSLQDGTFVDSTQSGPGQN